MKADGITPPMPPNPLPQITGWLIEIGLSEAAGMGVVPLTWREIEAWTAQTGVELTPWQSRLIRRLSADYIGESRRAELETCPAPWRAPVTQQQVATEVDRLRMVLG